MTVFLISHLKYFSDSNVINQDRQAFNIDSNGTNWTDAHIQLHVFKDPMKQYYYLLPYITYFEAGCWGVTFWVNSVNQWPTSYRETEKEERNLNMIRKTKWLRHLMSSLILVPTCTVFPQIQITISQDF